LGAPIVDRNLARDDPTTPSRASRTSKRAASTWTNRRVHRPADAPSTGSRRLRRATAPSFHSEPPTLHPRLTRPRPSPATVPQASEAAGEPTTRIGRVKLNLRHIMHRHATGTKRARACLFLVPVIMILVMVTRPIYAPLIDVFGPEEQVAGSKRAVVVERDAGAGGADDARRGDALGSARRAGARRVLLDVPPADEHRTSLEGVSFARWFAKGGWGSGAENGSETVRRSATANEIAREIARRGEPRSDPRV